MSNLLIQKIEKKQIKPDLPVIKAGYTVRVHQKIKEGEKERIQIYEGLVIALNHGHGPSKTMTVRKVVEGIGVEKIFPLNSPAVAKIEVVRIGKVRRAKLYYMRDISGKAARLKEMLVGKGAEVLADKELEAEKVAGVKKVAEVEATPVEDTTEKSEQAEQ